MKGNIRKRSKNGGWQITLWVGTKPDGKPQRHYETIRGSKADAYRRLRELLTDLDKGVYTPPSKITVAEFLKEWLEGYCRSNCSTRTCDGYETIIRRHLIPALGHLRLCDLQPRSIQMCYSHACASNLSNRTVLHFHRVLSQALKFAVKQGYLGRNPAESADPPRAVKKPMRTLTPAEVDVLLTYAQNNYYYPVIYTAVSSGMRQAELLGLRWRDVDLDMLSISVSQVLYKKHGVCTFKEPKTMNSRRRVAMTPKLAQFLKEYQAESESLHWRLGRPLALDDLVFANMDANPIDASTLTHTFGRLCREAGLEHVRFHDLRHTFASLMLLRGAKPKVISEALGHASVAFTMDTYSHIISGMQEDAMALLDEVLPQGILKSGMESVGL